MNCTLHRIEKRDCPGCAKDVALQNAIVSNVAKVYDHFTEDELEEHAARAEWLNKRQQQDWRC